MSDARDRIMDRLQRARARRGADDAAAHAAVDGRLAARTRGPIPARAQLDPAAQVDLFVAMAEEQAATVTRVAGSDDVPAAVAAYLKAHNLPPRLRIAPDAAIEALPWAAQPLLSVAAGRAEADDEVSLTGAFAGIAETGTLMLHSGPAGPTTLNFLPETHMVVLRADQVVGAYEDAWDRTRAAARAAGREGALPRTVNFITGPSRTADIEQTIQLGAHGPRRLHIVLVEDGAGDGS